MSKAKKYLVMAAMAGVFSWMAAGAQPVRAQSDDLSGEVVETEIGMDQMIEEKDPGASRDPGEKSAAAPRALTLDEQKEKLINESLKNAVEENKKLSQDNQAMEEELKKLRGDSEVSVSRINFLNSQRESLQQRIQQIENQNKEYQAQMNRLQATMAGKEKELNQKLADTEKQIADKKAEEEKAMNMVLPRLKDKGALVSDQELADTKKQAEENLKRLETHTQQVTTQVAKIALENKKMKIDSAKLHYNLANTFFERGDYMRAASEYRQVVTLLPNDADAHYNLAFVYGEFLNQPAVALEHYKAYLHLNPYASDAPLVKEKILEAELFLKSAIDSPAEDMLQEESNKEEANVMVTTTR